MRVAVKTEHLKVLSHTTNSENQHFATSTLKFWLAKCYVTISYACSHPSGPRHLSRCNMILLPNPGTSNSDTWRICMRPKSQSTTASISYWDEATVRYLDTWTGFKAAKTAPYPSRGLHHFGKLLEPSDEWAGRGCCCFLMRWHSWTFLAHQKWAIEICQTQIWIFQFFASWCGDIVGHFWLIRNEL